jgi:hypothetical protein
MLSKRNFKGRNKMIKEIKVLFVAMVAVLFVAMVAMMMLTGVASAVASSMSIELTDPINSANVNAVEITGTGFTAGLGFVYSITDDATNISSVSEIGTVDSEGNISATDDVSSLDDGILTATVFYVGDNPVIAEDTATKDTVLPTITINTVDTPTNTNSQTVTGTMEDGATVKVTCSAGTVHSITEANTTWSAYITNMQEGDNVITATATDWAGNIMSADITIFVDTVPPTITINTVDTPTNTDSQTVTGTVADAFDITVECDATVSNRNVSSTTWSVDITNMSEGDNVITAIAIDEVGNSASVNATIVLDTGAPVTPAITLTDPINITNVGAVTITGTGEADAEFEYLIEDFNGSSVDGDGMVTGDGIISITNINVSDLIDGKLTAHVWLTDAAGNKGDDGIDTATKDTVAPNAPAITLLDPINIANVAAVTITGSGEVDASIRYSIVDYEQGGEVEGTGTVAEDGSISVTGINASSLGDGELTAYVWLTDAAGNEGVVDLDIATKDTVAPIADAGQDQTIVLGDTVQFTGSGSYDPGDGNISYSWDFGDDSGISTDAEPSYKYEKYGTYTVTLTVTDNAGNIGTDTMTVTHGIKLNVGWNLVSTPLIPDNTSIEVVLSDVNGVKIVWSYDADTSSWSSYTPVGGAGGELAEITAGKGYWFDMSAANKLVIEGTYLEEGVTPPTYSVYKGWNLIGVHSIDLCSAEAYLSSTSFNCAYTLHGYQDGAWVNIDIFEDDLKPGYGYWAYMTADGALAP